jgi:hypothetical protein
MGSSMGRWSMAKYVWEVPENEYPVVAETVMRLAKAEKDGDVQKVEELTDRLRSFPCYPKSMTSALME